MHNGRMINAGRLGRPLILVAAAALLAAGCSSGAGSATDAESAGAGASDSSGLLVDGQAGAPGGEEVPPGGGTATTPPGGSNPAATAPPQPGAPSAPGKPSVRVEGNVVSASWAAPSGSVPVTEYRAFAFDAENLPSAQCNAVAPTTECAFEALPPGSYIVKVRALSGNLAGSVSQASDAVEVR